MAYTTVDNPELYFQVSLYTGNGSVRSITLDGSEDMQPDFVWIKNRGGTYASPAFDAVRGATKFIETQDTNVEATDAATLTGFNSDGFALGADGSSYVNRSSSPNTYVAWNWKANGAGSSNTDGSITSTVSANTTSGFSIVKWTASGGTATVGHGLGAVPRMIIVKSLANTTTWMCQHASLGNAKEIYLNNTSAAGASTAWNSTTPTSTVFSVTGGAGDGVNASGDYIAYCFSNVKGFSAINSYTGNGDADGPYVHCGFRPSFLLGKNTGTAGNHWFMVDDARSPYNGDSKWLKADATDAELTNLVNPDFLANGFKIRNSNDIYNDSGETFIYIAFAEAPSVNSNGVPCTAR